MRTDLSHCILCNARAVVVGVWFPDDPVGEGMGRLAPGKRRAVAYGLCARHYPPKRKMLLLIEDCISKEAKAQGGGQ